MAAPSEPNLARPTPTLHDLQALEGSKDTKAAAAARHIGGMFKWWRVHTTHASTKREGRPDGRSANHARSCTQESLRVQLEH